MNANDNNREPLWVDIVRAKLETLQAGAVSLDVLDYKVIRIQSASEMPSKAALPAPSDKESGSGE